jgi:hypothetical protein
VAALNYHWFVVGRENVEKEFLTIFDVFRALEKGISSS